MTYLSKYDESTQLRNDYQKNDENHSQLEVCVF